MFWKEKTESCVYARIAALVRLCLSAANEVGPTRALSSPRRNLHPWSSWRVGKADRIDGCAARRGIARP